MRKAACSWAAFLFSLKRLAVWSTLTVAHADSFTAEALGMSRRNTPKSKGEIVGFGFLFEAFPPVGGNRKPFKIEGKMVGAAGFEPTTP